jgi:hypothetical protein
MLRQIEPFKERQLLPPPVCVTVCNMVYFQTYKRLRRRNQTNFLLNKYLHILYDHVFFSLIHEKGIKIVFVQNLIFFFVTFSPTGRLVGEGEEEAVGPQDH